MTYETQAALLADLNLLSLAAAVGQAVHPAPATGPDTRLESEKLLYQSQLLVERDTAVGPVLVRVVQSYYVLANGEARFGQLQREVLEFLHHKQELEDPAYDELDAAERVAAMEAKTVSLAANTKWISWNDIKVLVSYAKTVGIQAFLAGSENAVYIDAGEQLTAGKVDPVTATFQGMVDAIAAEAVGTALELTTNEVNAIKGMGKQLWRQAVGITVRPYIVEALTA